MSKSHDECAWQGRAGDGLRPHAERAYCVRTSLPTVSCWCHLPVDLTGVIGPRRSPRTGHAGMVTPCPKATRRACRRTSERRSSGESMGSREGTSRRGEQCRVFGAAGIIRMPIRLHISWQDDTTLKMEIDNGNQTRYTAFPINRTEGSWRRPNGRDFRWRNGRRWGKGKSCGLPRTDAAAWDKVRGGPRRKTAERIAQSGDDKDAAGIFAAQRSPL